MTDTKLVDSSVVIDYILHAKHVSLFDSDSVFYLCSVSLFEIEKFFIKRKASPDEIEKTMLWIEQKFLICEISGEMMRLAAPVAVKYTLGLADSLIYMMSLTRQIPLYTADNDFRKLENCVVV
jgi:predicted nucleic acid-binding protein